MSTILIEGEPCVACGTQVYQQSGDVVEQLHDLDDRPWCVPCARTVLAESGSKEEQAATLRAERAEAEAARLRAFISDYILPIFESQAPSRLGEWNWPHIAEQCRAVLDSAAGGRVIGRMSTLLTEEEVAEFDALAAADVPREEQP